MICTMCYSIKNDNKNKGQLVSMTLVNDQVVCYACAKIMAKVGA